MGAGAGSGAVKYWLSGRPTRAGPHPLPAALWAGRPWSDGQGDRVQKGQEVCPDLGSEPSLLRVSTAPTPGSPPGFPRTQGAQPTDSGTLDTAPGPEPCPPPWSLSLSLWATSFGPHEQSTGSQPPLPTPSQSDLGRSVRPCHCDHFKSRLLTETRPQLALLPSGGLHTLP